MALPKNGMTLVTPFQNLVKKDFATAIDLSPTATVPLMDGEFLKLDTDYTLKRATVAIETVPGWAVNTERGRYDTQAIGKVTVLWSGSYEADFKIWDLDDFGGISVGEKIGFGLVGNVLGDAEADRSVLTTVDLAAGKTVVGWVTKSPSIVADTVGSVIRVYVGGFHWAEQA